ncbi:Clathrin coat assembly protein AP180 [Larimichthys crocea]|uniref:Uncharacterized protein n=1 Tax=Larimichthys crocea TaxID=215358 RepID=A0ACD3QYJ2_LARCR|nr:Clathrin coat assembly protein AP180 [Larimichthys crocea]
MSGQTLTDRIAAAQYQLTGSDMARAVCKATTHEVMAPKKKHLEYLVSATNTTNVNIPQMADTLFERATNASWVVVFKALVTSHHMCVHGNERFIQYLASRTSLFNLSNFIDKTGSHGYDMSTFIRRYGRYLNEKAFAYRQMAFDFTRVKKGAEGVMRTMTTEKLLKGMPVLQTQIDTLLEFDVHPKELNNGIINAAFLLLFKDLVKLFASYNDGIINLLEKYFKMKKSDCKEALEIYKRFLTRVTKIGEFMKLAETVGVDKNDIPDINYCLHPGVVVDLADSDDEDCPFQPLEEPVTIVTQGALAECLLTGMECRHVDPSLISDAQLCVCLGLRQTTCLRHRPQPNLQTLFPHCSLLQERLPPPLLLLNQLKIPCWTWIHCPPRVPQHHQLPPRLGESPPLPLQQQRPLLQQAEPGVSLAPPTSTAAATSPGAANMDLLGDAFATPAPATEASAAAAEGGAAATSAPAANAGAESTGGGDATAAAAAAAAPAAPAAPGAELMSGDVMKPTLTPQTGDVDTSMANMASNLTMGTSAAPQVAPPCWGAPMTGAPGAPMMPMVRPGFPATGATPGAPMSPGVAQSPRKPPPPRNALDDLNIKDFM